MISTLKRTVLVSKEVNYVFTFDEVLPTHPQMALIEVDDPLCRVLDVGRDREVKEIVCAIAPRSEAIIQLLPGNRTYDQTHSRNRIS